MAPDTRFGAADDRDDPDPLLRSPWEDTPDETDADRSGAGPRSGTRSTAAPPAPRGGAAPANANSYVIALWVAAC
jgi:hypothetical protein